MQKINSWHKESKSGVKNIRKSSKDQSPRINMENLRLRDDCQREGHIRGSYPVSLRGQNSQLVGGQ